MTDDAPVAPVGRPVAPDRTGRTRRTRFPPPSRPGSAPDPGDRRDHPRGGLRHDGHHRPRAGAPPAGREGRRRVSEARVHDRPAVHSSPHRHLHRRRPAHRRTGEGGSAVPGREDDRSVDVVFGAPASRGPRRLGRDERLADGGRDVGGRKHSFPKFTRDSNAAARAEALHDDGDLRAGAARPVHLRGPRRPLEHRRAQHRSGRGRRAAGYGGTAQIHGRHRDHPAVPADAARTCAVGSRSMAPACGSPASTCCRMALVPTSRARSTWRTGPSRRGT